MILVKNEAHFFIRMWICLNLFVVFKHIIIEQVEGYLEYI